MDETYIILETAGNDGKASVKRVSDGMIARCKPGWLSPVKPGVFKAKSNTKAIRLDGLEWTAEG